MANTLGSKGNNDEHTLFYLLAKEFLSNGYSINHCQNLRKVISYTESEFATVPYTYKRMG